MTLVFALESDEIGSTDSNNDSFDIDLTNSVDSIGIDSIGIDSIDSIGIYSIGIESASTRSASNRSASTQWTRSGST